MICSLAGLGVHLHRSAPEKACKRRMFSKKVKPLHRYMHHYLASTSDKGGVNRNFGSLGAFLKQKHTTTLGSRLLSYMHARQRRSRSSSFAFAVTTLFAGWDIDTELVSTGRGSQYQLPPYQRVDPGNPLDARGR